MRRAAAFVLLALAVPARAGVLAGYVANDPASINTFDRFPNGIGSPTPNTSSGFVGAGLDLSGIGFLASNPQLAVSLISPQYILGAAHVGFGTGSVSFVNNQGVTSTFALATNPDGSLQTFRPLTGTTPSDVLIGRLAAPVPAASGISFLPVADLTASSAVGLPSLAYTQNTAYGATGPPNAQQPTRRQLGLATLSAAGQYSFAPPFEPNTIVGVQWQQTTETGSVLLTGGDSGGPLFTRGRNNETALIGGHFGVDTAAGISVSSFLPAYIDQINSFMVQDGYTVTIVPVPEPAGLLLAAAGAVALRRCSRRVGRVFEAHV